MTTDDASEAGPVGLSTTRLEAFSDGVFAIAITLLVLEISVPHETPDLLRAVLDLWPSYLAYLISFATIGAIWLGHTAITHYLRRATAAYLRLNLVLLLVVAFLPFPTSLLAQHTTRADGGRVATTAYGLTLLLAALLLSALWRTALRTNLIGPDTDDAEVRLVTRRLTPSVAGYLVLIAVGTIWPVVAAFGYLVVAVYLLLPITSGRRRIRRSTPNADQNDAGAST
jgi:uncharacterized membrane protein